ncbi:MAG TPA: vitamin K epoxide reductase family protein [Solirubrobacteraceae bacterium]
MSARTLRATMVVLSVLGLGVASYLTYTHYANVKVLCALNGGCETVQHSSYATLVGVPVALIGLIGYVAILGSLLVPENETTRFATAAFTVVGFGFSAYLTGRELFSIHAICQWCVSSAVIMTLLMGLAIWRFLRGDDLPLGARPPEWDEGPEPEPAEPAAPLGVA